MATGVRVAVTVVLGLFCGPLITFSYVRAKKPTMLRSANCFFLIQLSENKISISLIKIHSVHKR
jgi:hypothetical protein